MNELQHRILDKAKERFERFGYKKTTMDEISADCRISKKTVYELFGDKEQLFHSLHQREREITLQFILASIDHIQDPLEQIKQLIRTTAVYLNENNFITRLLKDEDALFSAVMGKKYRNELDENIVGVLAEIVKEGKKQGTIRDIDEKIFAYAGLRLVEAFTCFRSIQFDPDKEQQGDYTRFLLDFIVHGVEKK